MVKLPLPLRGKGGYLPGASLSCILCTTLCMDTSPGGMFDPGVLGDKAPDAQGADFRIFVVLGILAAGDALVRGRVVTALVMFVSGGIRLWGPRMSVV